MLFFVIPICVFFLGLIVFHALERRAPVKVEYVPGPKRSGYLADFTASVVNGPVMSTLMKIAAYYVVFWVPVPLDKMSHWPWALQLVAFFLINDFARYWLHRWYHESDFLWRFHRVHHSVVEMDSLSTFRVHLFEAAIKYGVLVLPLRLLGVDKYVVLIYSVIDILKGYWHHANLRTYIGPLNYILNSAELHWWHHSTESRGQRANYGSIFSIWDWLFRTAYWPKGEWPETIGLEGVEAFPETYTGMFSSMRYDDEQAKAAYSRSNPETGIFRSGAGEAKPDSPETSGSPLTEPA